MKLHRPRLLAWLGALVALAIVFASYLDPHFALEIASRAWACF